MYLKLNEITDKETLSKLLEDDNLTILINKEFNASYLDVINEKCADKTITIKVFLNKCISPDFWTRITNCKRLCIHASCEIQLNSLDFLSNFNTLESLELTSDYTNKNLSFNPIGHICDLKNFTFISGLSKQYSFLNQQKDLKSLYVGSIDFEFVTNKENLTDLLVQRTLKSEHLLPEKCPNLEKLHLYGCSRLKNHSFLSNLAKIKNINVSYNSYITEFPKIQNPELVKTIEMFTCPNFSSIDSLLPFKNLEKLVLTSHDKPLQVPIQDFEKLTQLKKLKTVYTAWGRRPKTDLDIIAKIYNKTRWINSSLEY
ncbi:hypothetical protein [Capnocytophaga felis]|uniref:Internalin n=1 Tax=Capnocytophaga felis TaxID=2267611 RepID=A0A5M4BC63_9FLAO|nr:hypothetical protein [Capnocytophaga felis]GET46845.1 hypothetical protein RCZ01_21470 [Capnocytophaga felis]GET48547.1 hypothetical protein RCZ02_13780 [Capnocytophaga felis]